MNRSEIEYQIYLHWDSTKNRYDGTFNLAEKDAWDSTHFIWILENVSLAEIFIHLDLLGVGEKLVDRESWLDNLNEE